MGFWETVGSSVIGGVVVAIFVTLVAVIVTDRYAAERDRQRARADRDLAAAEELYRVHGQLFAAWKAWEYHSRSVGADGNHLHPADDHQRSQLIQQAADAEGGYESLIVRIAVEHRLSIDDEAAMWSLRVALKQLRYAIRKNRRLDWWRTDSHESDEGMQETDEALSGFRRYQAFKTLIPMVAGVLTRTDKNMTSPSASQRSASLQRITGNLEDYRANVRGQMQQSKPASVEASRRDDWVLLAEHLDEARAGTSADISST